ncbi:MAG: hypothetical protein MZU95_02000 [Desulfomicrobium escambiense]|nr:hypothetical protein [Desulfomicrobium escambiense]
MQRLTPNDAAKLVAGQVQYTGPADARVGCFVDDMLVYCIGPGANTSLVVNAANIDKDFALDRRAHQARFDVQVEQPQRRVLADRRSRGRWPRRSSRPLTDIDLGRDGAPSTSAKGKVAGDGLPSSPGRATPARTASRSTSSDAGRRGVLWASLIETGEPLRAPARRPGRPRHPAPRGQADALRQRHRRQDAPCSRPTSGWIVKLKKGDFLGKPVTRASSRPRDPTRKLVGFEMAEPGIARHGYPVFVRGASGSAPSPPAPTRRFLKKAIGLVYLPVGAIGRRHRVRDRHPRQDGHGPGRPDARSINGQESITHQSTKEARMYPNDFRYTKDHEWIKRRGRPSAVVGITDYAQHAARRRRLRRAARGRQGAEAGRQPIGVVESVKAVSDVYAPVAGDGRRGQRRAGRQPEPGQQGPLRRGLDRRSRSRTSRTSRARSPLDGLRRSSEGLALRAASACRGSR